MSTHCAAPTLRRPIRRRAALYWLLAGTTLLLLTPVPAWTPLLGWAPLLTFVASPCVMLLVLAPGGLPAAATARTRAMAW